MRAAAVVGNGLALTGRCSGFIFFLSFFFLFLSLFSFPFYIIIGQSRVALGCLFLPIRQIKIGKFPSEFANWLILFGRDPVNQSPVGVYVSVIDRN